MGKGSTVFGIGFLFFWLLSALAAIGIPIAIVLIVIHFARKFW